VVCDVIFPLCDAVAAAAGGSAHHKRRAIVWHKRNASLSYIAVFLVRRDQRDELPPACAHRAATWRSHNGPDNPRLPLLARSKNSKVLHSIIGR